MGKVVPRACGKHLKKCTVFPLAVEEGKGILILGPWSHIDDELTWTIVILRTRKNGEEILVEGPAEGHQILESLSSSPPNYILCPIKAITKNSLTS